MQRQLSQSALSSTSNFSVAPANSNSFSLLSAAAGPSKTPKQNHSFAARRKSSANNHSFQLSRTPGLNQSATFGGTNNNKPLKNNKTPNKAAKLTPSRQQQPNKTPTRGAGDRYIPNRSMSMMELGHYMLSSQNDSQQSNAANTSSSAPTSPQKTDYERAMRHNLTAGLGKSTDNLNQPASENMRILSYQKGTAPKAPLGFVNSQSVLYASRPVLANSCQKSLRHIPTAPERVLDAPEILDDYYLNLIDWGPDNWLAVALGAQVFLWSADSGEIKQLMELDSTTDYVSCVKYSQDGQHIAVALSDGKVELWHVLTCKRLREFSFHTQRVASLAWNQFIIVSGARDGTINQYDVRLPLAECLKATLNEHTQEVCGLSWSPDRSMLASGGNDNRICIWRCADGLRHTQLTPTHVFTDHMSAVKALAWCPWQHSILATGGGTADRMIRFWNCNTGQCIAEKDSEAQVVSLIWSEQYKELVSATGYPSCALVVWKYPQMTRVAELKGHEARILCMSQSPCGEYVMSVAADESLRMWHCFAVDAATKKKQQRQQTAKKQIRGGMMSGIR